MAQEKLISFMGKDGTPEFEGVIEYKNPRLFTGNVPSYADYFCTDDESIASAYEEKGVKRYEVQPTTTSDFAGEDSGASGIQQQPSPVDSNGQQHPTHWDSSASGEQVDGLQQQEKKEQRQEEEVSWRDMAWPQMRAKAASLTDRPITSKAVAIEVLEEHLG